MLKKRLIFTLIHDRGHFMLSRNFRLQKVGDVNWLNRNYGFSNISTSIDELVILDASRESADTERFCEQARAVARGCFMPVALGGGLRTKEQARMMTAAGADKLVVNTALADDPDFVRLLVRTFGAQCVIASVDYRREKNGEYAVHVEKGARQLENDLAAHLRQVVDLGVGEIYLNSINQDGTGQGYDMDALAFLPDRLEIPVIMAGGAGNHLHLQTALAALEIDAVATANLFNFVGSGLPSARQKLLDAGIELARWPAEE